MPEKKIIGLCCFKEAYDQELATLLQNVKALYVYVNVISSEITIRSINISIVPREVTIRSGNMP
jgi:hypothetical protein